MRRTDRQVTSPEEIRQILQKAQVCSLALCDGDAPYVVPVNYGYFLEEGELTLYFHGAAQGRKVELIRQNPKAAFAIHCDHQVTGAEISCGWGFCYSSVLGEGTISPVEDQQEKIAALTHIMEHYDPGHKPSYNQQAVENTAVFALKVSAFTAKARKLLPKKRCGKISTPLFPFGPEVFSTSPFPGPGHSPVPLRLPRRRNPPGPPPWRFSPSGGRAPSSAARQRSPYRPPPDWR